MAVQTRTFPVNKEQSVADFSGTNRGNGSDKHAPIGLWSGTVFRELIRFAQDWDGMFQVLKIELRLRTDGETHLAHGANPRLTIRRVTDGWQENGGAENSWSTSANTHWGNQPSVTGSVDSAVLGAGQNGWRTIDITDIYLPILPTSVMKPDGTYNSSSASNLGIRIASFDEGSSSRSIEFWSSRASSGNRPELRVTFDDNVPPEAPTIIEPEQGDPVVVATPGGKELTVTFDFNDADDTTCARAELEVYPNAITDGTASAANRTATTGVITPTETGTARRYTIKLTGLPARTDQRYRLRVRDPGGAWSPWTSLADGRFQTAYVPGVPLQPVMQTTPDSPHVFGTINSPDTGDFVTGWEGEFYRDNPDGSSTTLWAPGLQTIGGSSTRSDVTYAGAALQDGDRVRWRHRHANRDGIVGTWSPFYTTTIRTQVGPTITPGDTGTKLTTRTPTITLTAASFDGHRIRLFRGDAEIHDSGLESYSATTSKAWTPPAGLLAWGDTIGIEAAVRPAGSGTLGPYSPRTFVYINSLPVTALTPTDGEGNGGAVIPTLDVLWSAPYLDPDRGNYGEQPAASELEVRVAATPKGSGTLVTRRHATAYIVEEERTGQQIEPMTATTGWTASAGSVGTQTFMPGGYSGATLTFSPGSLANGASAKVTKALDADLATLLRTAYGGGAIFRVVGRLGSAMSNINVRLRVEGSGWSAEYPSRLMTAGYQTFEWAKQATPAATTGTPWSSDPTHIGFVLVNNSGGSLSPVLWAIDLRIGTTQTAKDTPDGHLAPEASYDARRRYRDDATAKASTTLAAASTAGATNVKVSAITNLAAGDELTVVSPTGVTETRTISTVGTAGSGGTGVTVSEAFTHAHDNGDTVEVRYWGPWTSWRTIKASVPPTVAADAPADSATVTDPTPDLVHTYSSPGGKAQASRTWRLFERVDGVDQLLAEQTVEGTGLTDTLPVLLLEHDRAYAWEKTAADSEGLADSTDRRSFTTDFTAPDRATGPAPTDAWSLELADDVVAGASALPYTHPFVAWIKARAVSYWRMNEPSGTGTYDLLGVQDGVYTGGAIGAGGLLPGDADAGSFDMPGGDDARMGIVTVSAYTFLGGTTPWTWGIVIDIDTFTFPDYAWLYTGGLGGVVFILTQGGTSYVRRTDASGLYDDAQFNMDVTGKHLYVVTYDGSQMAIYRDGLLATGGVNPAPSTRAVDTANKVIRMGGNTGTTSIDGRIGEAFLIDSALTADEVAELAALMDDDPGVTVGDLMRIDAGATSEIRQAEAVGTAGVAGTGITVAALRSGHSAGAMIEERSEVVATSDPEAGTVTLEWDASGDSHAAFYIVRWRGPDGQMVRIDDGPRVYGDGRTPLTDTSFTWDGARLGTNQFEVTVSNGVQESDPADAEVALGIPASGSGHWVAQLAAGPVRLLVPDVPRVEAGTVEAMRPPGRAYPIHLHWGTAGRRVSLRTRHRPAIHGDLSLVLRALFASGAAWWLKAPEGYGLAFDTLRVRVAGFQDAADLYGWVSVSLEVDEVAPPWAGG